MIHLDTSFLIRALVRGSTEADTLRVWIAGRRELGISSVAWAEFLCGPLEPDIANLARNIVGEAAPFDDAAARTAARLFNHAGRRRGTLADCMVAATAIENEAHLATANSADFRRLESGGLRLVP